MQKSQKNVTRYMAGDETKRQTQEQMEGRYCERSKNYTIRYWRSMAREIDDWWKLIDARSQFGLHCPWHGYMY